MSTHTRHATEPSPTTEPPSDPDSAATPPSTGDDADARADADAREEDAADDVDGGGSWVALCQSQFDARRTARLRNLADAENLAMPNGL